MSVSINQQINEMKYQEDLNRLAKKRNDEELDKCCNTCKMYLGVIAICVTVVILISVIVIFIINAINK